MNREEMINMLVEDRLTSWVYIQDTFAMEEALRFGWKGFDDYTNDELKAAVSEFDAEEIKELREGLENRWQAEKDAAKSYRKNALATMPF